MATNGERYITKSKRTFNDRKGSYDFWAQANPQNTIDNAPNYSGGIYDIYNKYVGWQFPKHDMSSLGTEKIVKALDYYQQYVNEGGNPSDEKLEKELKSIVGGGNFENKMAYLDYVIDLNAAKTGFDSSGTHYTTNEDGTVTPVSSDSSGFNSGLDYYKQLIEDSLATNKNSEFAKQYQADMYSNINSYEQATNATLASAELDAYRMLGQQQLQLENQIASERMQALKAGTTSAQLASRELANMFAAQSSAQQIAQNVLGRRADVANTYNQQRAGVVDSMYNMLANNQTTAANAYAQLGAAQASYNSYMQQPWAQYQSLMGTYNKYGDSLLTAMGLDKQK